MKQREILFKAKRLKGGEWLEGQLTTQNGRCFITDDCIIDVVNFNSSTEFEYECEVIPETVCQYTGLKDKNGKKIFEGDEIVYKGKKKIIIFDGGAFGFIYYKQLFYSCECKLTGKNIHDEK